MASRLSNAVPHQAPCITQVEWRVETRVTALSAAPRAGCGTPGIDRSSPCRSRPRVHPIMQVLTWNRVQESRLPERRSSGILFQRVLSAFNRIGKLWRRILGGPLNSRRMSII
jgi:hypothetical protein